MDTILLYWPYTHTKREIGRNDLERPSRHPKQIVHQDIIQLIFGQADIFVMCLVCCWSDKKRRERGVFVGVRELLCLIGLILVD